MVWDPAKIVSGSLAGARFECGCATLVGGTVEIPTMLQTVMGAFFTYTSDMGDTGGLYIDESGNPPWRNLSELTVVDSLSGGASTATFNYLLIGF